MKKLAGNLVSLSAKMSYSAGFIALAMLLALTGLVTLEVILRYGFRISTYLAEEYSLYLLVGLVYLATAHALQADRHIKIDVISRRFSARYRLWGDKFVAVLNLSISVLLSWRAWFYVLESYRLGRVSSTVTSTPLYIPALAMSLGFTMLAVQAGAEITRLFISKDRQTARKQ